MELIEPTLNEKAVIAGSNNFNQICVKFNK